MTVARTLSRRSLLLAAGSAPLAAALAPSWSRGATPPELPRPAELPWRRGAGGVYEGTLTARPLSPADPLTAVLQPTQAGYAGSGAASSPGPLIRLVEGRSYRLRFVNQLAEPTNLHLHGLRIPPAVDAPFRTVRPGASATYAFTVPHGSAATYWYHPHLHGLVESQLLEGLVGGLLIDPPRPLAVCAGAEDVVAVLQPLLDPSQVLVNGVRRPHLSTRSARLRMRVVNASTGTAVVLRWVEPGGRPQPLWLVASDAGFLPEVTPRHAVTLPAGGRVEFLADVGHGRRLIGESPDGSLPRMTLLSAGQSGAPGTALRSPRGRVGAVPSLRPAASAVVRDVVLGLGAAGLTIDGRQFDPDRDDVVTTAGSTEIWRVTNTTTTDHPFHLHSYPVQLLRADGTGEPAWRDVVTIPAQGVVELVVPFAGYAGRTVFHCHIAAHEDDGMMAVVNVR